MFVTSLFYRYHLQVSFVGLFHGSLSWVTFSFITLFCSSVSSPLFKIYDREKGSLTGLFYKSLSWVCVWLCMRVCVYGCQRPLSHSSLLQVSFMGRFHLQKSVLSSGVNPCFDIHTSTSATSSSNSSSLGVNPSFENMSEATMSFTIQLSFPRLFHGSLSSL